MRATTRRHRPLAVLLGVVGLLLASGAVNTAVGTGVDTAAGAQPATHRSGAGGQQRVLDRIELPDGFLPEGITIGRAPVAYLGSRADGDIYAANLRSGRGRVISQGPGTPSVGLKLDRRGRLFVAGGTAGNARVVDVGTGKVLGSWTFSNAPSFVNDVVLTRRTAWFTDSLNARLYGVRLDGARRGRLPARFVTLPLSGQWSQTPTVNNANGIAATPDGRALLVVKSDTGELFRVNRRGAARRVDLGGTTLTNGDGLLVRGRTLYAVQNQLNRIAVLRLDAHGTRARLVRTITSDDFDVPTTVASYGRSLFLPNARFSSPQTPTTQAWITRVDR